MARITVEDCLQRVENRFALIHLAAKRVRQLRKGAEPLVGAKNSDVVIALREIADGSVYQIRGSERFLLRAEEGPGEAPPSAEEIASMKEVLELQQSYQDASLPGDGLETREDA